MLEFHFTMGPVQGFVGQARRTRDLWAGSFLLSWLAAVAMRAVRAQGGEVVFPVPDEGFMRHIDGEKTVTDIAPRHGGVPNRFKAMVEDSFDPTPVIETVRLAWAHLADKVWEHDIEGNALDTEARRALWGRQINGFWDMSWVLVEEGQTSDAIDRRKNLRANLRSGRGGFEQALLPPSEPGSKCMVMEGWQEFSGVFPADRRFWATLQTASHSDLRDGEQLCAIAWVKRRFVRVFDRLGRAMPGGWTLHGWIVEPGVPSVSYMAACTWLARLVETEDDATLAELHDAAKSLSADYGEWSTELRCVESAYESRKGRVDRLRRLDGDVFFETFLDNPRLYPSRDAVDRMREALHALETDEQPAPFYAVLMMDGDSLGELMAEPSLQQGVSVALAAFAASVGQVVDDHSGFLIYAGGDDVLAVLPVEHALPCAASVRVAFTEAFSAFEPADNRPTISAAVSFVHVKVPLMRVVGDTHELLDKIAKEKTGRDALAVEVRKPGGVALHWSMPWNGALNEDHQLVVLAIAQEFAAENSEFSTSFLYGIREQLEVLNPERDAAEATLDQATQTSVLAAGYMASGVNVGRELPLTMDQARERVERLLDQCRPRIPAAHGAGRSPGDRLEVDGALLIRFLAKGGRVRG